MEIAQMTVHCAIFGKGSKGTVIGKKIAGFFFVFLFIYVFCNLNLTYRIQNTSFISLRHIKK